ncbi:MAG: hypothetical protein WEA09_13060 [Gemmatimonadota bacterium]
MFSLSNESVSDTPLRTLIEQHIVASGTPTVEELEAELTRRFQAARDRRGFEHHNPATNIFIYIYGTEEQARAGQGLWLGMLAFTPSDDGQPIVTVSDARSAAASREPEERYGLSEQERREIFREIAAAEDRAMQEAMERVPDSEVMRQIELERELGEQFKAELASRYGLTLDELRAISSEGVLAGWPY